MTIELRTRDKDMFTSGENGPDESKRGGDKTPGVQIPEVNIDPLMEEDACSMICNSGAST
jgi:hypothetical protein